ncbi:hypothetical protein D3C86_1390590 [compost metagenome]
MGVEVRDDLLAPQRLNDRRAEPVGQLDQRCLQPLTPAPDEDHRTLGHVQDLDHLCDRRRIRRVGGGGKEVFRAGGVLGQDLEPQIDRDAEVRRAAAGVGGADGARGHDPGVEGAAEHPVPDGAVPEGQVGVELLVLLGAEVEGVGVAGQRQEGDLVAVGLEEAVGEVGGAGARRRQAGGELARQLGVGGGHEGPVLLVPDQDELDPVPVLDEAVDQPVDVIPRDPEHVLDAPVDQRLDDRLAGRLLETASNLVERRARNGHAHLPEKAWTPDGAGFTPLN